MYTDGTAVREYISAGGTATFGTAIIGTAQINTAIADAQSIVDMRLSKRYDTPFSAPYPPAISTITKVLSSWRSLRSVYSNEIPQALQFVEDDYKKAMQWLDELKNEEIDLPAGTATSSGVVSEKGESSKYYSSNQDYYPVFDVDSELNWKVDVDRLSDIGENRG